MKKLKALLLTTILLLLPSIGFAEPAFANTTIPTGSFITTVGTINPCPGGEFLGLPKWDAYLNGQKDPVTGQCTPVVNSISDVWLIIAAVIEMLLRIAGIGAVIMVIYGGIRYTTSMGSAESVNAAKSTIMYAIIGLVIAVTAAFIVTFIAGGLGA